MPDPKMFYFGPWDQAGHYLYYEDGRSVRHEVEKLLPWGHVGQEIGIDGVLQPGCAKDRWGHWRHRDSPQIEGEALIHHLNGWTALSFWDRSVDKRGACNSNYFAEGTFTFEEMVEMASRRFAYRWRKMSFPVFLSSSADKIYATKNESA